MSLVFLVLGVHFRPGKGQKYSLKHNLVSVRASKCTTDTDEHVMLSSRLIKVVTETLAVPGKDFSHNWKQDRVTSSTR